MEGGVRVLEGGVRVRGGSGTGGVRAGSWVGGGVFSFLSLVNRLQSSVDFAFRLPSSFFVWFFSFFVVCFSVLLYESPRRKPGWRFTAGLTYWFSINRWVVGLATFRTFCNFLHSCEHVYECIFKFCYIRTFL